MPPAWASHSGLAITGARKRAGGHRRYGHVRRPSGARFLESASAEGSVVGENVEHGAEAVHLSGEVLHPLDHVEREVKEIE